jgi:hypothetical protein
MAKRFTSNLNVPLEPVMLAAVRSVADTDGRSVSETARRLLAVGLKRRNVEVHGVKPKERRDGR